MPVNEHEVFVRLTSGQDTSVEIDFLAYAIFAFQKREWMTHFAQRQGGAAPTQAEIDLWISNLTDFNFQEMQHAAVTMFDYAARVYLQDELKAARNDGEKSAIIAEVKAAGSFWKQLGLALITAILAPVLLGAIVGAVVLYDRFSLTPTEFLRRLSTPATDIGTNAQPGASGDAAHPPRANQLQ